MQPERDLCQFNTSTKGLSLVLELHQYNSHFLLFNLFNKITSSFDKLKKKNLITSSFVKFLGKLTLNAGAN